MYAVVSLFLFVLVSLRGLWAEVPWLSLGQGAEARPDPMGRSGQEKAKSARVPRQRGVHARWHIGQHRPATGTDLIHVGS
jgi:hypothetical protein